MTRRLLIFLPLLVVCAEWTQPVLAQSKIIVQKSSKLYGGSVFIRQSLIPGHQYRIEVTATGHQSFTGSALEQYLGIYQGNLFQGKKPLPLSGRTPQTFTQTQPISSSLKQWVIALHIQLRSGKGLTVKLVDNGKHK